MMPSPLLEIKDLCVGFKVFEGTLKVLDGINLSIYPGEKVGLIGEIGSGKTTLMKTIVKVLLMPPAVIFKGEILFNGKDILKMNKKELREIRRNKISMIFEDPMAALNPVFKIGPQLKDTLRFSTNLAGDEYDVKKYMMQILKDVSLPDPERILKNYPFQLSGGMRQRICISMALGVSKALLIADEPDTSLDVTIKDQILRLLSELVEKRNTSIILISHTLGAIKHMANRIYVMYAGSIMEEAKIEEFFDNPLHPYSQGLVGSVPKLTGDGIGEGIDGRIIDYINPPTGCRFHPRCKHMMPICKERKPPLCKVNKDHRVACFLFQGF